MKAGSIAHIASELQNHRIVKPQRLANLCAQRRGGIGWHHLIDRIAGKTKHRESQHAHREHDANSLQRTAKRKSKHVLCSPSVAPAKSSPAFACLEKSSRKSVTSGRSIPGDVTL